MLPRMMRQTLPLAAALTAATVGGPARGGEPTPAPPAMAVSDHVKRGDAARTAARCGDAVAPYRAALDAAARAGLDPAARAAVAAKLGQCEAALGRHRDAAEHLRAAMDHLSALPLDQRARVTREYENAVRKVARWAVEVNPADAEVLIDDRSIGSGKPTYLVFLEPGTHTARARLANHSDFVMTGPAVPGEVSTVVLTLSEARPAGKPLEPPRLVAPAAPDGNPVSDDDETASTLRRIGYASAGASAALGVGLLVAHGATAATARDDADEARGKYGRSACALDPSLRVCKDLQAKVDTGDTLRTAGIVSLIVAGAIGGVAVSSLWWAPSEPAASHVEVVPTVEPQRAGVTLFSRW